MHFSLIFNPINIFSIFLSAFGSIVVYKRLLFNSQATTIVVTQAELKIYKDKVDRIDADNKTLLDKDRKTELRMLELESGGNRAALQHQFDRDEIDILKEIVTLCMVVILPLANGTKARIETKMIDLSSHRQASQQKMQDYDDQQRVFRIYTDKSN